MNYYAINRLFQTGTSLSWLELRIATFPGLDGDITREVKLADIEDNMTRPCPPEMLDGRKPGGRYVKAKEILSAS